MFSQECSKTCKTWYKYALLAFRNDSPSVKSLVQGDYMWDWCQTQHARKEQAAARPAHRSAYKQTTTKAACGHAEAAQRRMGRDGEAQAQPFKLKRFKSIPPIVQSFRSK